MGKDGQPGNTVRTLAAIGNTLLVATDGGGVFRSTDSGAKWTAVNTGLPNLYIFSLATNGSMLIFCWIRVSIGRGGGIFKSADSGASWTATGFSWGGVNALAATSNGTIFAAYVSQYIGVFRSLDTEATWTAVMTNVNSGTTYMTVVATSGGYVFAGGDYYVFSVSNPPTYSYAGVYRSVNNGDAWTAINNGLTLTSTSYLSSFVASGSNVFVGIDDEGNLSKGGVFLTTSNGDTWSSVNTGLTDLAVMALTANNGYLLAGTYAGNIWRRPLSEMVAVKYVQSTQKHQNMVDLRMERNNILRYSLEEAASVSIKVYDIRGRLVSSSVNIRQSAGTYTQQLSTGRLAQGNYIIDFNAGDLKAQRLFAVM